MIYIVWLKYLEYSFKFAYVQSWMNSPKLNSKNCLLSFYLIYLMASKLTFKEIAELIQNQPAAVIRLCVGLATGSTPLNLYKELIRLHQEEGLSFANVVTFNLDEYYPVEYGHAVMFVGCMKLIWSHRYSQKSDSYSGWHFTQSGYVLLLQLVWKEDHRFIRRYWIFKYWE